MRVDRLPVDLDGMLEVLGGSLTFSKIREEVGQMDTRSEVVVVKGEALLVVLHTPLEILFFL